MRLPALVLWSSRVHQNLALLTATIHHGLDSKYEYGVENRTTELAEKHAGNAGVPIGNDSQPHSLKGNPMSLSIIIAPNILKNYGRGRPMASDIHLGEFRAGNGDNAGTTAYVGDDND